MPVKQLCKPLSDSASSTQNSYSVLFHFSAFSLLHFQSFFHPPHTLDHLVLSITERNSQKAFSFAPESCARNRDDPILQAFFRNLDVVAKRSNIKHRVKRALRRCRPQTQFRFKQVDQT